MPISFIFIVFKLETIIFQKLHIYIKITFTDSIVDIDFTICIAQHTINPLNWQYLEPRIFRELGIISKLKILTHKHPQISHELLRIIVSWERCYVCEIDIFSK